MADVFISYSRRDRDFVLKLHDALSKLERDTWVDWEDIPLTADFLMEIYRGIEGADNFVFVISPESIGSPTCQKELAHAAMNQKRLIPVLHRHVADDQVPETVAAINWIFFRDTDNFESAFGSFIDVLDIDLDWKRAHTRLLMRAVEWQAKSRNESFLLRGMDLQDALRWLGQAPHVKKQGSSELQLEYIKASQEWEAEEIARLKELNEEKERQRREAEHQRSIATARELAAYALNSLVKDPERSLLFSMHAVAVTGMHGVVPEAEDMTHRALLFSRIRMMFSGHEGSLRGLAWSPDGERLATAGDDGTAKVWDMASGKELLNLTEHKEGAWSVAWSPDGSRLAVGCGNAEAHIWEATTGRKLLTLSGHNRFVRGVAWSPDGKRLATASGDRTARIWDVESGRQELAIFHEDGVTSVAWSPDGKYLATAIDKQTAMVWDATTGEMTLALQGADSVEWYFPAALEPRWATFSDGNRIRNTPSIGVGQNGTETAHPGTCGCKVSRMESRWKPASHRRIGRNEDMRCRHREGTAGPCGPAMA